MEFKKIKGEKGFTLIELLVVIAILGILAVIAIPNITGLMDKGKEEAAVTELYNVQIAVTAAMAEAQLGEIEGGVISNESDNVVIAEGITVSEYIIGGYASLNYSYNVGTDGLVTALTSP